jgi:hypothetical protein
LRIVVRIHGCGKHRTVAAQRPDVTRFAAKHQAIFARHHQIEDDQAGRALLQNSMNLPSVRGERDAHAVLLKVVNDQYTACRAHQCILSSGVSPAPQQSA